MSDLLVIGGGAAGLAAAREGVRAGLRTAMVTDGPPGGDCTFTGCVPSKTLLAAAARGERGAAALARVRATVDRVAATETVDVLRDEGIAVHPGRARFVAPRTVLVGGQRFRAPRVVLATGAAPTIPAIPGLAAVEALTSDDVFALDDVPESLAVLGGGPQGCELAQAFARLGAAVTLLEAASRLLPALEADVGAVVRAALERDGVDVRTGAAVTAVAPAPGGVRVVASGATGRVQHEHRAPLEARRLLLATGRRPSTDGLGAAAAGVALTAGGAVVVDARLATGAEGVWAAGDVTGLSPHSHAADEMGRIAVANATRSRARRRRFDPVAVPRVVFTDPEVATVGITEHDAHRDGTAWVAEVPLSEVDRAVTAGREDGFVRLVAGVPRPLRGLPALRDGLAPVGGGRVLGATIVAERAGEMIAEVAVVMRIGAVTGRLAQTVHAYPTWALAVRQAAARLARSGGGARPARGSAP